MTRIHGFLKVAVTLAVAAALATACGTSGDDLGGEPISKEIESLREASATAMADVTSVRFDLTPSGAPIYIDAVESLALTAASGRYAAPGSADAVLTVEVNGSLTTRLGAVAIDSNVWLSNPVTGDFELLPTGFDIDPTTFFDPEDGWQPLIRGLAEAEFIAEEDRDGLRYHLSGTASADRVEIVTAGLVAGQDVHLDLWVHPVTALVTAAEFSTVHGEDTTTWVLELSEYGTDVVISAPEVSS